MNNNSITTDPSFDTYKRWVTSVDYPHKGLVPPIYTYDTDPINTYTVRSIFVDPTEYQQKDISSLDIYLNYKACLEYFKKILDHIKKENPDIDYEDSYVAISIKDFIKSLDESIEVIMNSDNIPKLDNYDVFKNRIAKDMERLSVLQTNIEVLQCVYNTLKLDEV